MKRSAAWLILGLACTLGVRAEEPWTLPRTLDYALAHNPEARLAQHRVRTAEAGLAQANAAFQPHLQLQSSYSRTDNPMVVFGDILIQRAYKSTLNFNNVPDVDDLNVRGVVTLPLYAGGRIQAARDAAQAGSAAARQTGEAVRNALAFEVVRAFQTVLKTREFIRATAAAVEGFETNRAIALKRLEGGTLLKSDVLDLAVRLAQAREDHVRARAAHALAQRALLSLLGLETGTIELAPVAPSASVPPGSGPAPRPELVAAAERERAAQAQLRGAKSGYQPRVNAFGSLDHDSGWVTHGDGSSYHAGVLLQWDLWDGQLTRARTRKAQADLETAREEQRKLRLALDFEAAQARLELDAAQERLSVSAATIAQAEESVRLLRARFEQGLALAPQVIDAETALVSARVRRAEAESDQRIAVAALRQALGWPQLDPGAQ